MNYVTQNFGRLLYEARSKRKWSQTVLADFAQVTRHSISEWETGRRDLPLTKAVEICKILNIDPRELFRNVSI